MTMLTIEQSKQIVTVILKHREKMEKVTCKDCKHGAHYTYNGEPMGYKCSLTKDACFPECFHCPDGKPREVRNEK